jgi:diaminopimelate epimerase
MIPKGRRFYKMSGSGNDFVFIDARNERPGSLEDTSVVEAVCQRGTGVGADGIVFLLPATDQGAALRMRYLNRDGSLAALCGNATLCATRLAVELGIAPRSGFRIETDSGVLEARMESEQPEFDLPVVADVQDCFDTPLGAGEQRIGFALAGVPHLVVLCRDVESVDVEGRGRPLRHEPTLVSGANVNFVSKAGPGKPGWRMRTYERGVESETLACGTGAASAAILLTSWGAAEGDVEFWTRSGRPLRVRLRGTTDGWYPSLSGAARIVFVGELGEYEAVVRASHQTTQR